MKKMDLSSILLAGLILLIARNISPVLDFYWKDQGIYFWFMVSVAFVGAIMIFSHFRTDSKFLLFVVLTSSVLSVVSGIFELAEWGIVSGIAAVLFLMIWKKVSKPPNVRPQYMSAHPDINHPW